MWSKFSGMPYWWARSWPDWRSSTSTGHSISIVVNLWATWCPPCVREMPLLQEAQVTHADVHFVFLNQGENEEQVSSWLSKQHLPLRNVLLDPERRASAAFQQKGYPTTLFFDSEGTLVSVRTGELSKATLSERLGDLVQRP